MGTALTKDNPAGRLSVTDRLVAVDGPKLVTEMVYAKFVRFMTAAGPLLVMLMSACGVTVVITGGVELVGVGSGVGDVTVATFVRVPLAGA